MKKARPLPERAFLNFAIRASKSLAGMDRAGHLGSLPLKGEKTLSYTECFLFVLNAIKQETQDMALPQTTVTYNRGDAGATTRTIESKLSETLSITDFGAVAGDSGDQTAAIQAAIDAAAAAGGGAVLIPTGVFRITSALALHSNVEIYGSGHKSVIHLVNTSRSNAFLAIGTQALPLSGIRLRNFAILGDKTYDPPIFLTNGGGIFAEFCNNCSFSEMLVDGFSDGGIFVLNGNENSICNNRIRRTAQGCGYYANAINCYGNVLIGNQVSETGLYNGLHLEGSFGDVGDGLVIGTVITGNTVIDTHECGLNIELAPQTAATANTIINSGLGSTTIDMGIKLFGAYQSTVVGNIVVNARGYGIIAGANSGNSTIAGNTTYDNGGGSLLVTDSSHPGGAPIQTCENICIGANRFIEGEPAFSGNASAASTVLASTDPNLLVLRRVSSSKRNAQIVYGDTLTATAWRMGVDISTDNGSTQFEWCRDGIGSLLKLRADGQLVPTLIQAADDTAAAAAGVGIGALYHTAGNIRVRLS